MIIAVVLALVKAFVSRCYHVVYLVDGDSLADAEGHCNSEFNIVYLKNMRTEHLMYLIGKGDALFNACIGYYEEELLTALARVIGEYRPEVIFAPDPEPASECHIDHRNVGRAAARLALFASNPGIMAQYGAEVAPPVAALAFYMTARPNRYVAVRGLLERQKTAIFSCHKSQFPDGGPEIPTVSLYLKVRSLAFGLRSAKGAAEGFRVLGQTQMHCFPEAD